MIPTRIDSVVDTYHGTPVPDPYRWLENPDSPETEAWVTEQNAATRAWIDAVPERRWLQDELTRLWNYPRSSAPEREGGRYFFHQNSGLQNQAVFYVQDSLDAEPRVVLDPNTLSEDGTVALTALAVSWDGTLLAYGTSSSGSDWQELHVREIDTGREYSEVIQWCKFTGIAWRHDGSGFYYNRFPAPGSAPPEDETNFNRVYFHRPGTPQADDLLIYERPDAKELGFDPIVTDDGRYLVLNVWHGTDPRNRLYYRAIDSDGPFIRLLDDADAAYQLIDSVNGTFYIQTDRDAPKGRIVAIDLARPEPEHWREILPEQEDVIDGATLVNHQLLVVFMSDAHHVIRRYTLDGTKLGEVPLPTLGSVAGITGRIEDTELFLGFMSYLYPATIFRYTFADDTLSVFKAPALDFDPSAYETTQVFAASKDGTAVPIFLTYRRGIALDGNNPTLLYGYGGFNISLTPGFSIPTLLWVQHGGVYAVANLRGGGEYGEDWHQGGILTRKQNVFDDFISAAEWLIDNGYTRPAKLAVSGGSNGGLLVAACVVQRPDLFGAAVSQVPVADMLRYHRPEIGVVPHAGRYWVPEYGDPDADEAVFRALHAYSPYHNARPGTVYPPVLITTADHDDRVVPGHSYKLTAALQAANSGPNPILLRVDVKAGHGGGKPLWKVIEEEADVLAFLFRALDANRLS